MDDLYFKFWTMHLGFDFIDIRNGRTLTKGEFFRKHTEVADALAQGAEMPEQFVITPRPPFTPYVVRNGKIKENHNEYKTGKIL